MAEDHTPVFNTVIGGTKDKRMEICGFQSHLDCDEMPIQNFKDTCQLFRN